MKTRFLLTTLLAYISFFTQGQNLINYSATQQGNEVVVNYSLDGEKGRAYSVNLFASTNNFSAPLQLVEGDVAAKRVLPGSNKIIRWRVLDELKNFDGDVSFEIRAVTAVPLFKNIESSSPKVKRGKEVTISWSALNNNDPVNVELVQGEKSTPIGTGNAGKITYIIPKKMKTDDYRISLNSAGETVRGGSFAVKPKYPLWMKAIPLVVVGAVITFWPDKPEDKFPEPPDLTN